MQRLKRDRGLEFSGVNEEERFKGGRQELSDYKQLFVCIIYQHVSMFVLLSVICVSDPGVCEK